MSSYDYRDQLEKLNSFTETAHEAGWLSKDDSRFLNKHDDAHLLSLFQQQGERPLVVAFFGGTGVGKSSLLNRLAGEEIAKPGVQRPTSMEVTLYLHNDFKGDLLPDNLPTEGTRIAWHNQDERRFVAWLDLPDMDSTARENAALVEAWLPYIDWIIYVVSPERYHDDLGWRFLQSRGQKHAWLFVMNHWDQGTNEQLDDFRSKLQQAQFSAPTILRTSCVDHPPIADDFVNLEATINEGIHQHGLSLLKTLGIQAQIEEARQHLAGYLSKLDDSEKWREAGKNWEEHCEAALTVKLKEQLSVTADALSQGIKLQPESTSKLKGLVNQNATPLSPEQLSKSMWNSRHNSQISDLVISLINHLQANKLPFQPFAAELKKLQTQTASIVKQAINDELTKAMAKPGTAIQRFFYRLLDLLSWLLPLTAAAWAIYHVATTFLDGTQGEKAFLGINFAIHSGLLIGLAWLIPWLLKRKLKPSIYSTIRSGLKSGINSGTTALNDRFLIAWQETITKKENTTKAVNVLQKEFDQLKTDAHHQVSKFVSK